MVDMGNAAGVRRDFEALEKRRLVAADLLEEGVSEAEVARRLNVHRQSVNRWAEQLREGGRESLEKAGRAGRKPRLSPKDLERIEKALKEGPQASGYGTNLWTLPRVAVLIEKECGIRFHPGHVWRVLKALSWSCQRPAGRARERDEARIDEWKKKRWPALKRGLKQRAAPSSSSTKAD